MKKNLSFIAILCMYAGIAQYQIGDTLYYAKNYQKVAIEDANFFAIVDSVSTDEDQKNIYTMDVYALDGKPTPLAPREMRTQSKAKYYLSPMGHTTYFYKDGKKEREGIMQRGNPAGVWYYWYESGQLKSLKDHPETKDVLEDRAPEMILDFWDEKGEQLITEGNGLYRELTKDTAIIEGRVENKLKVGTWTKTSSDGNLFYKENYEEGKLVSGESWHEGTQYNYTTRFEKPKFNQGQAGIRKVIIENFKYPRKSLRLGIQGTVLVGFKVDKEGKLTDIRAVKSVSKDCDAEAVRVVSLMENWTPGKIYGRPVITKFAIPIKFVLQ